MVKISWVLCTEQNGEPAKTSRWIHFRELAIHIANYSPISLEFDTTDQDFCIKVKNSMQLSNAECCITRDYYPLLFIASSKICNCNNEPINHKMNKQLLEVTVHFHCVLRRSATSIPRLKNTDGRNRALSLCGFLTKFSVSRKYKREWWDD